jgi:hypothetical protein
VASPVRLEDLPSNVQRQVVGGKKPRTSRREVPASELGLPLRCECGETFSSWSKAERHAQAAGHGRVGIVLVTSC